MCCPVALLFLMWVLCTYQAKDAIKEAHRCDPDSIFTQFNIYKIAVLENNAEKGICETLTVWWVWNRSYVQLYFQQVLGWWGCHFTLAAEAVNAMGVLSKSPVAREDRLLVSEKAASSLLSLAAQIALEVRLTGLRTWVCVSFNYCHISQPYGIIMMS